MAGAAPVAVYPMDQLVEFLAVEGPLDRALRVGRSLGVSALRCRIAKYSSIWFSQEACTGDASVGRSPTCVHALYRRLVCVRGAVVDDPVHGPPPTHTARSS